MAVHQTDEADAIAAVKDPVGRTALKATFHLRRFMPLYVFGTIWAVMLMAFPTIVHNARSDGSGGQAASVSSGGAASGGASDGATAAEGATTSGDGSTTGATTGAAASTAGGAAGAATKKPGTATAGAQAGGATAAGPVGKVAVGTGKTVAGADCGPDVRQVPRSLYAPPCVAKFEGNNGGATYRGVTDKEIKISIRVPADAGGPNAQTVNEVSKQAGQATADDAYQFATTLLPWFNKNFELYGRKVTLEKFAGNGNGTDEAQSKGQEAACADADAIASTQKAFGVVRYGFGYESQPFAECSKQYKLYLPLGAPYFPENYYQRWDPYVWGGTMECERIAHDVAEYIGKRLIDKPAKWAGDPTFQAKQRSFATYVPNNDGYQHCVDISENDLKTKYHTQPASRYDYTLDVSQFPSEAARGIVQFQAAGATTIIMACDPISTIFLTEAAAKQSYHPEWLSIGVALQDTDGYARLWNQSEVDGHLFGLSQLGSDARLNDKNGEASLAWKEASGGKDMPNGAAVTYYLMMQLFDQLQAAGPTLSPESIAKGSHALPPGGGPTGAAGTWDMSNDHTAINDSREIYYTGKANGYDGKAGSYVETYGGRRYQSGQWPAEDPPIYK